MGVQHSKIAAVEKREQQVFFLFVSLFITVVSKGTSEPGISYDIYSISI